MSIHWGGRGAGHVNRLPLGLGRFSPATLFATGEQGAWYDPSDLTTLFQDSAGATPVTAAAQQVGLMLDKSQGLVLGPEIVANGDFSSGTTGWTAINSTLAVVGGACEITAVGGAQARCSQSIATVVGRWYEATARIWQGTGTVTVDLLITGITSSALVTTTTPTNVVVRFLAVATTTTIRVGSSGSAVAGTTFFADNVSVKLLPGNHAFQSNSAQRPTLGREPYTGVRNLLTFTEQFDNAAWPKSNVTVSADAAIAPNGTTTADKLIETAPTGAHQLYHNTAFTNGVTYTLSVYMKAAERTLSVIRFGDTLNKNVWFNLATGTVGTTDSGVTASISDAGNGWYRCIATITSGTTSSNAVAFECAVTDGNRSYTGDPTKGILIWGAQLETGSTATAYQRVVSSFDVTEAGVLDVWYLSFDGTDDGMLTGTITPGIDKAQVFTGVRKLSDAASGTLIETSTDWVSNNGTLTIAAPSSTGANSYRYGSRGTSGATAGTGVFAAAPNTSVLTGISDIAGDVCRLNRNGVLVEASTADQGTGNYLAYPLYIGRRAGATLPYNGRIYSLILRFGANLSASTILQTETWVGDKTGINIPLSVSPTIYDRFNDTVLDRAGQTIEVR